MCKQDSERKHKKRKRKMNAKDFAKLLTAIGVLMMGLAALITSICAVIM